MSFSKNLKRLLAALSIAACVAPALASDRVIVYPLQNPSSTQQSLIQRYPRVAIGNLVRDMLGSTNAGGVYTNMTINPGGGLYVDVAPTTTNNDGTLYQLGQNDANPIPVNVTPQLAADPTVIMLQGVLSSASSLIGPIAVPGTSGQTQYTLIEAQIQSQDTNPQQELFVNQAGGKYYATVNTDRTDAIVFQAKAGTAGTSPSVPSTDTGWVSIGTILVPYGATSMTSSGVVIAASTPFPGFITSSGSIVSITGSAPITVTSGASPNVAISPPISVGYGGTGATSLPSGNVLLGNGTGALAVVSPGPTGNTLQSNGTTWISATPAAAGVSSFSAASTGLTPSTATTGAVTLGGTLDVANGGSGASTLTGYLSGNGTSPYTASTTIPNAALVTSALAGITAGSDIVYTAGSGATPIPTVALTAAPSVTNLTVTSLTNGDCVQAGSGGLLTTTASACGSGSGGVTSFSAGTTGFTPSTGTTGAVTLAGTLGTANGGTNLTSFTSGGAVYASSSSALTTGTLPVASGGSGAATITGYLYGNGTSAFTGSTTIPNSALVTSPLAGITAGNDIVYSAGSGSTPIPTVAVTNAPSFSGAVTASQFDGSGAGLTSTTVPNAALVTSALAGITAGSNIVYTAGSGATPIPTVALTAAPSVTSLTVSTNLTPGYNGTAGTSIIYSGTGTPSFSAPAGSLFLSYSGTGGALAYYNSSSAGTSGTTWTAIGSGGSTNISVYPSPSASPFPMGCAYNSTLSTLSNGAQGEIQCDVNGRAIIDAVLSAPSPLPVMASPTARTYEGSTITTGGTAQTLFTSGALVHGCDVQNTSTGAEYIRADGTAASATSLYLAPGGGFYECPITGLPTTSVSIYGATTGQTFYAEQW